MRTRVICFSGIDGSGKSLHARLVFRELTARGVKCKYEWLRYPRFFSSVPLALSDFLNLKKSESSSGSNKKGSKDRVVANRAIGTFWVMIMYVDTFFNALRHVYLPTLFGYTMVLDRFALDTLIDTVVGNLDRKNENLTFSTLGRLFVRLIPKNSFVLIFDIKENIAALRIQYTGDTSGLARARVLYRSLGKIYSWNVIYTDKPVPEVHDKIMKLMSQKLKM